MGMRLVEDEYGLLHAAVPHPHAPQNIQVMILKSEDGWWSYVDGERIDATFPSQRQARLGAESAIAAMSAPALTTPHAANTATMAAAMATTNARGNFALVSIAVAVISAFLAGVVSYYLLTDGRQSAQITSAVVVPAADVFPVNAESVTTTDSEAVIREVTAQPARVDRGSKPTASQPAIAQAEDFATAGREAVSSEFVPTAFVPAPDRSEKTAVRDRTVRSSSGSARTKVIRRNPIVAQRRARTKAIKRVRNTRRFSRKVRKHRSSRKITRIKRRRVVRSRSARRAALRAGRISGNRRQRRAQRKRLHRSNAYRKAYARRD